MNAVMPRPWHHHRVVGVPGSTDVEISAERFREAHDRQPNGWQPWAFAVTSTLTLNDVELISHANCMPVHPRWAHNRPISQWYECHLEIGNPLVIRFRRCCYADARKAVASLLRYALSVPGSIKPRIVEIEVLPFK